MDFAEIFKGKMTIHKYGTQNDDYLSSRSSAYPSERWVQIH